MKYNFERQRVMTTTLTKWYTTQISIGKLNYDLAQETLLTELEIFLNNFARQNFITRLFNKNHKLGYYIYGDVGRGKSMIMNAMYQFTNTTRKTRLHFHEFMHDIHTQLAALTEVSNPLINIAKKLKQSYDIIYLDEMHVSDITTAMIMKGLLEALFANKIYIVTSSNYHPDGLWPNGLMRERFLPAIETLKEWLIIKSLNSQQDYRLFNNSFNDLFIHSDNHHSHAALDKIFNSLESGNYIETTPIKVCNRDIAVIKRSDDAVWFDFSVICGDMRSQLDYLELSETFNWFIISNVYQLDANNKDIARRFTWLVDILYDNNRKLALSSTVPITEIYNKGDFANEFERTISRLEEMQTKEYLEKS